MNFLLEGKHTTVLFMTALKRYAVYSTLYLFQDLRYLNVFLFVFSFIVLQIITFHKNDKSIKNNL